MAEVLLNRTANIGVEVHAPRVMPTCVMPGAAAIVATTFACLVTGASVGVPVAPLTATPAAPTVTTATVAAPAATVTVAGQSPAIVTAARVLPPALAITTTPAAPGVGGGALVAPATSSIGIAAHAAAIVPVGIDVPAATVTATARTPLVDPTPEVIVGAAAIACAAVAPGVSTATVTLTAGALDITVAGQVPAVTTNTVAPGVLQLAAAAHAPSITKWVGWGVTGLPCPRLTPYSYSVDLGLLRTPFQVGNPRQTQHYDQRPRQWTLTWSFSSSQLETVEVWLDTYGYTWFDLPLISPESVGATPVNHRVRLIGDWHVRETGLDRYQFSVAAEMAAADETCSLVTNCAIYTVCLDTLDWIDASAWPTAIGIDYTTLASTWGTESAPWVRYN